MPYLDRIAVLDADVTTDEYDNDVLDWTVTVALDVPAQVSPLASDEQVSPMRDTVTTRYRMHVAPTVEVSSRNRIAWHGDVYEVDGDVERHTRRGAVHHLEFVAKKSEG